LLKPHYAIQDEIESFKINNGLLNREVIAMQIRRGSKETSFVPIASLEEELMFYTCAKHYSSSQEVFSILRLNPIVNFLDKVFLGHR
jgi:hypothetical protein